MNRDQQNHRNQADDVEVQVEEPWHHPGQPAVDEVPPDVEARRREATRRQQRMTEDKTGKVD